MFCYCKFVRLILIVLSSNLVIALHYCSCIQKLRDMVLLCSMKVLQGKVEEDPVYGILSLTNTHVCISQYYSFVFQIRVNAVVATHLAKSLELRKNVITKSRCFLIASAFQNFGFVGVWEQFWTLLHQPCYCLQSNSEKVDWMWPDIIEMKVKERIRGEFYC